MDIFKRKKWLIIGGLCAILCMMSIFTTNRALAEGDLIFKKDEVSEVNIEIDEADLQDMLDNPMEEEYKEGTITYNGETVGHTGVRVKGNSSLRSVANSDSDRYSFKLKFDKYIDQNLGGYTKINLNNNFSDPSYMREYLTYELLADMGLATPNYSYVNVSINGELYGLYLAIENIEDTYLERNFGNVIGNLYKADSGASLTWEDEMSTEETNLILKSGTAADSELLMFIETLHNGGNIESYFDVDQYLRYLAVSTVTANMDSYQGTFSHNYYLYEQDGKFTLLAWDHNMGIGGMMGAETQLEMLIDEPTMGAVENYPLVEYVLANDDYKEQYHRYVQETVDILQDFEFEVDELASLIGSDVKADPTAFYSYDEFIANSGNEAIDGNPGIVGFINDRIENVQRQLDGEIPSYENGEGISGGGGNREGMEEGDRPEGMPEMEEGERPEAMPEMGEGDRPEGMPEMEEGDRPEGMPEMEEGEQPEDGPGIGMGQGFQENKASVNGSELKNMIIVGVLIVLLFVTMLFVSRFRRYQGYKKFRK